MYTLAIADDEAVIRDSLASLIDWGEMGFEVAAVASDGSGIIELLRTGRVDVVLTDIKMKKCSGLDVASYIADHKLPTLVVLLSGYREFELARQAISLNVTRYLLKPISLSTVSALFRELRAKLDEQNAPPEAEPVPSLPMSQPGAVELVKKEVIRRPAENPTLQQMAARVNLSYSYLSRLFKEETGETYTEFLVRVKMQRAMELLDDSSRRASVRAVSETLGYDNIRNFYKHFKRVTGVTPSEYRRNRGVPSDDGMEADE